MQGGDEGPSQRSNGGHGPKVGGLVDVCGFCRSVDVFLAAAKRRSEAKGVILWEISMVLLQIV